MPACGAGDARRARGIIEAIDSRNADRQDRLARGAGKLEPRLAHRARGAAHEVLDELDVPHELRGEIEVEMYFDLHAEALCWRPRPSARTREDPRELSAFHLSVSSRYDAEAAGTAWAPKA
jgi:hypothetical protein